MKKHATTYKKSKKSKQRVIQKNKRDKTDLKKKKK